jgi:hypothetical protein
MTNKLKHRGGCLCCPRTEDLLSMDEVLYNGFGGYSVHYNGEYYWSGDPNGDWDSFPTLERFEQEAKEKPGKWEVVLLNPLRGATWERKEEGKWVLTETNQGFA